MLKYIAIPLQSLQEASPQIFFFFFCIGRSVILWLHFKVNCILFNLLSVSLLGQPAERQWLLSSPAGKQRGQGGTQQEGILSIKFSLNWSKISQWKLLYKHYGLFWKGRRVSCMVLKGKSSEKTDRFYRVSAESGNFSSIHNKILTLKINLLCLLVKFPIGVKVEGTHSSALTFLMDNLS